MPDLSSVDVDEVLISLKSLGKYQIIQTFLFVATYLSEGYQTLGIVFIGKANPYTCAPPPGQTVNQTDDVYGECSFTSHNGTNTTSCIHGYSYLYPKDMSISSDFDLACDKSALTDLSQTLLNLGMIIGSTTLTLASDRFGRKKTCVLSHLACLASSSAVAFAPNYTVFIILKLISGAAIQGTVLTAVTYLIEIYPEDKRRVNGFIGILFWSAVLSSMAPVAYLVRNCSWRVVQLTLTSVSLYSLIQYWVTEESIRWLVANNRLPEVVRIVKKAARINKVNVNKPLKLLYKRQPRPQQSELLVTELLTLTQDDGRHDVDTVITEDEKLRQGEITEDKEKTTHVQHYTLFTILKHKRPAGTLLIVWYLWFANGLTYYGIYLTTSTLAGNMYVNFFLGAMVEAPSAIVFWFLIDRIGRKKTSILFHSIAAFGLIVATALRLYDDDGIVATMATVFSLIGKFGIAGAYNVLWTCTPELFPTNVRNVAYGSANAVSRIAGMVAPFANLLAATIPWAPGAIFGVFCLISTGLVWFLPEMMGKEMPQTMEDMERLYVDKQTRDV